MSASPHPEDDDQSPVKKSRPSDEVVDEDVADGAPTEEDLLLNEEYLVWRKNAPFLYDIVQTQELETTSYTVSWLRPDYDDAGAGSTVKHKLLLGTHAPPDESNYILIAQIQLPSEDADLDNSEASGKDSTGGLGVGPPSKFQVQIRIPHDGDVNRARFNPRDELIIASRMANGQVGVFNYGRHTESPKTEECVPHLLGTAHTMEGFGLDWDPFSNGRLLTCADDGQTLVWNIDEPLKASMDAGANTPAKYVKTTMDPVDRYETPKVSDCQWSHFHASTFGTTSLDGTVLLWDARQVPKRPAKQFLAGSAQNSIAFAPLSEFIFATGGEDQVVNIWDVRTEKEPFHVLKGHSGEVYQVAWSPLDDKMLSSCGTDRRVFLWDLARIGMEQTPEDAEDGVPELLFIHAGHKASVSEMAWNPHHRFVIASVAEDNALQVWQPASHIFGDDEDDDDVVVE